MMVFDFDVHGLKLFSNPACHIEMIYIFHCLNLPVIPCQFCVRECSFLHLPGLSASDWTGRFTSVFHKEDFPDKNSLERIKPLGCCCYCCCSWVCHCWEDDKCCAGDPPWGTRVPEREWMLLSLCLSSPVLQFLLMKSQPGQQPGQCRAALRLWPKAAQWFWGSVQNG